MCLSWVSLLRIYVCRVHYLIVLFSICFLSFRQRWKLRSRDGGGNRNRDFWKLLDVKIFVMFFSFSSISAFLVSVSFFFSLFFLGNVIFMIAILFYFILFENYVIIFFLVFITSSTLSCESIRNVVLILLFTKVIITVSFSMLLPFHNVFDSLTPSFAIAYSLPGPSLLFWIFPKSAYFILIYLFLVEFLLSIFSTYGDLKTKRSLINLYYKIFPD